MVLDAIDRICRHLYVLALLLAALTFGLMPTHVWATSHANVTRVVDSSSFEVAAADLPRAKPGDSAPMYRFNNGWMREIGVAKVRERQGDQLVLDYDPGAMAWPLGIQGTVTDVKGTELVLNVGKGVDIKPGGRYELFEGRARIGQIRVLTATDSTARAELLNLEGKRGAEANLQRTVGKQFANFIVANQVTHLAWPWLTGLEWLAIAGTLALWVATIVSPVPGRVLVRFSEAARERVTALPPLAKRFGLALIGIPACFVLLRIAAHFWIAFPQLFWTDLRGLDQFLGFIPTSSLRANLGIPSELQDLPMILAVTGFVAWAWVALTGKNPIAIVAEAIRFRRERSVIYRLFSWVKERGFLNWCLHWVVFYLFARNLQDFLKANMRAAAGVGWARHQLVFDTWSQWFESTLFILTTWPDIAHWMQWFEAARYLTWCACIVGCLIGYGHTLLSVLWKQEAIHWVDFTLTGWLVNLMCYGAYANAVFKVLPHPSGLDPSVTTGPLLVLLPVTELFLNLVYTASIFNMGTKFGVMVDKGLVDRGFYSVVRHPSYTLEPLMFSVLFLNRVTTPLAAFALLVHPFMYWCRSERDDAFMGEANPDYEGYRERVKYKYFPGLW